MPSSGGFLTGVTYAVPCEALAPAGEQRWSVLVVAPDDMTIRAYFIGGLSEERCDLLRNVVVVENASEVNIQLQAGADPTIGPTAACSAVGQAYVTQVSLSKPLGARSLSGPNNQGEVEHLKPVEPGRLVRDGANHVFIQKYGGLNDKPPFGLLASVDISDPAAISKLVHEVNALPAFPGGMFCPMDSGSYFALAFTYADRSSTTIKVETSGCGEVYEGESAQAVAWTLKSPAFLDALNGLLAA